jgi:(R)-2-hydroxyacyl-CoA dehydratese activating ATPase
MIFAGIDAGSRSIKIALVDGEDRRILATGSRPQGIHTDKLAHDLLDDILSQCGHSRAEIQRAIATGYARNMIEIADTTVTEITCHGCGVHHLVPDARTVIEIGGQDSKLLKLADNGTVQDFAMNDRCAAGTGRFLEVVAERLEVQLSDLGELASRSLRPAVISSMCIVFAETEIIGLLSSGAAPEDIVAGVQNSIASRVASMVGRHTTPPVVFTGGVAMVPGMDAALSKAVDRPVTVSPHPLYTGALGAAILASR